LYDRISRTVKCFWLKQPARPHRCRDGGGGYDTDAADYFSRAEALGGSFDIDGTYTESVVKTAISDFVAICKTDGTWSKITEAYLLAGVDFSGLMAKLKYDTTATLTNNGFVSGDYQAVSSGAGLTGDGSIYLGTSLVDNTLSANDKSFGIYLTAESAPGDQYIGCYDAVNDYCELYQVNANCPANINSASDITLYLRNSLRSRVF
jgi:hypothetical protein